jgi:hypothetical protein
MTQFGPEDVEHVRRYDMALLEYRIHANYSAGAGWRWEVTAQDRNMIAKGIAVTHAQARIDMLRAGASTPVPKRSRRVLTSHPTWYRRLYQVWKARTSLTRAANQKLDHWRDISRG